MSAADELNALYRALLDEHPKAPQRFADACSSRLRALLKRRHPAVPREIVEDAAADAILAVIKYPERYQPDKGGLVNYLVHIADNRICSELRRLKRRKEIFIGGIVELALIEEKNYREEEHEGDAYGDPDALPPDAEALIGEILPDPLDRRLWDLVCRQCRETAVYAALLAITHLPPKQQAAEVKRRRDRVIKKIQRRRAEFRRLLYAT